MKHLDCEVLETNSNVDSTVIWLHGLGANGFDFVPIIPRLELPNNLGIRFIFPHAPSMPVTLNAGMVMPAWYDIHALEKGSKVDLEGIVASTQAIMALIEREIERGIDSTRIILAGFSQGGAIILHAGLSYAKPLAGLLSLSSYFPSHESVSPASINKNMPIAIYHGTFDSVVPEHLAKQTLERLESLGYTAEFKLYPMAHEVHPQEIDDISAFIQKTLS